MCLCNGLGIGHDTILVEVVALVLHVTIVQGDPVVTAVLDFALGVDIDVIVANALHFCKLQLHTILLAYFSMYMIVVLLQADVNIFSL